MQIDNRALDGFIEHFKTHNCYHAVCEECGYCAAWAKKVVHVDEEKRRAVLKKFDAFIEAIVDRKTLAENEPPDISDIELSPGAATILDNLMAFVPPPLAEVARTKTIQVAAQLGNGDGNGAVGEAAVVQAFWGGTPEPSRPMVRQALEQNGLWLYVEAAGPAS
jgi:hypothetical protein